MPNHLENEKVVVMKAHKVRSGKEPKGLRNAFVEIIKSFYANRGDELKEAWQLDDVTLEKIYDFVDREEKDRSFTMKYVTKFATLMYALRPNMKARTQIEQEMKRILPNDFDPNTAVGFPIRGSDKCNKESECRTFDNYMEMIEDWITLRTKKLRKQDDNSVINNIILTSEDKSIIASRSSFPKSDSFPYEFIVNENDIFQGTGRPQQFGERADAVMLSSMVSLKMQLHAESLLLNHCSNFHKLIYEIASNDCGLGKEVSLLSDSENPSFHLKCDWN